MQDICKASFYQIMDTSIRKKKKTKNRIGDKSPTQIAKNIPYSTTLWHQGCAISAWDTECEKRGEMTITGLLERERKNQPYKYKVPNGTNSLLPGTACRWFEL